MDPIHDNFAGSNPPGGGGLPSANGGQGQPVVNAAGSAGAVNVSGASTPVPGNVANGGVPPKQNNTVTMDASSILSNTNSSTMPINSEGGDVVLSGASGTEQKNKRLIVVIVAVVVLILLGVGLWALLGSGLFSGKSGVVTEYNKFANFVLYGEESDKAISDSYDENKDYYFLKKQETQEDRAALYEKANALYDAFLEKYNGVSNKTVLSKSASLLDSFVESEGLLIDFMEKVYVKDRLREVDYVKEYASNGKDATEYLLNYYDLSEGSDNRFVNEFKEQLNDWLLAEGDYLDYYSNNGCFEGGMPSISCILDDENADKQQLDSFRKIKKDKFDEFVHNYNYLNDFMFNVYVIDGILNDKNIDNLILRDEEGKQ